MSGSNRSISRFAPLPSSLASYLDNKLQGVFDDVAVKGTLQQELLASEELKLQQMQLQGVLSARVIEAVDEGGRAAQLLARLRERLEDFQEPSDAADDGSLGLEGSEQDAGGGVSGVQPLLKELAGLAQNVQRMERVRDYVTMLLDLERLVSEAEDTARDAAASLHPHKQQQQREAVSEQRIELLSLAVSSFSAATERGGGAGRANPSWRRLATAVGARLDASGALLKSALVESFRELLTSVGWPPLLSTRNRENTEGIIAKGFGFGAEATRQGAALAPPTAKDIGAVAGRRRIGSLAELSSTELQHLREIFSLTMRMERQQRQREFQRELDSSAIRLDVAIQGEEASLAMHALIHPIFEQAETHVAAWTEHAELVFALVMRTAKAHAALLHQLLQPGLDASGVVGVSVKEEWGKGLIVLILFPFLRRHLLPHLQDLCLNADSERGDKGRRLWVQAVDEAIDFDRQMADLTAVAGRKPREALHEFGMNSVGVTVPTSLSVFGERKEWLETWISIESEAAQERLLQRLDEESAWDVQPPDDTLEGDIFGVAGERMSGEALPALHGEDFEPGGRRSPRIVEELMLVAQEMEVRCRGLKFVKSRRAFMEGVCLPLLSTFVLKVKEMLEELQAQTSLAEMRHWVRVCACINAAFHLETRLTDWQDEASILSLMEVQDRVMRETSESQENGPFEQVGSANGRDNNGPMAGDGSLLVEGFFDEGIRELREVKEFWLAKLQSAVVKGFSSRASEYVKAKRRWKEEEASAFGTASPLSVSPSLVGPMRYLSLCLKEFQQNLGFFLFSSFWRGITLLLDEFLLGNIVVGTTFSTYGARQFAYDMEVVQGLFGLYTKRPSNFFKNVKDAIWLLSVGQSEAKGLLMMLSQGAISSEQEDSEDNNRLDIVLKKRGLQRLSPTTVEQILLKRLW